MIKVIAASFCCMIAWSNAAVAQEPIPYAYYPLKVGYRWTYRVTDLKAPAGKADPKRTTVIEVERKQVYTDKFKKNDKEVTKDYTGFILKMTSTNKSTLDQVVVLPTGVYRVDIAQTPITPPMLFFKPTQPGETWTLDSVSGNTNLKGTFTGKADKVTVPYSKEPLGAWLVSFHNDKQGEDRIEIDSWYVEKVGMVRQRIKGQSQEVLLELERFDNAK